ncbi:MAG: hypothetical protein RR911_01585 [Oscillospiraceae bacterium]
MIKGVNMQVLEIKDTGNDYFERVLLFVKPEYYSVDKEKLQKQAWDFTRNIGMPPPVRKSVNWKTATAKAAAAIVVGLVLSVVIVNL